MVKLKVLFCENGLVIVGNVLGINDGVFVMFVVSEVVVECYNLMFVV